MATTLSNSISHLLKPISLLLLLLGPVSVCGQDNVLYVPQKLNPGDYLHYGGYSLVMQRNCNLVLYDNAKAIWSTGTAGSSFNCFCIMQADGNFVVYTPGGKPVWASNTWKGGSGNYVLVVQSDRNLVVYGPALWATGTNKLGTGVTIGNGMVNSNGANYTMAGQNVTNTKA